MSDVPNTESVTPTPAKKAPAKRRTVKVKRTASKARTNKGRKFSFARVKLSRGTRLYSTFDPKVMVTVVSDRTIRFKGQEMTLSAAAKKLAHKHGKKWPTIQGPMYFTHKGTKLTDLVH